MIFCRSPFSGAHLAWRVTSFAYVLSAPPVYLQTCYLSQFRKMNGGKDGPSVEDRHKKKKTMVSMWRPISTVCSTKEGITADVGNQYTAVGSDKTSNTKFEVHSMHGQPSFASDAKDLSTTPQTIGNSTCPSGFSVSSTEDSGQTKVYDMKVAYSSTKGDNMSPYSCLPCDSVTVENLSHEQPKQDDSEGLCLELTGATDEEQAHSVSIEVDPPLLRFVKGKRGVTQRQIEEDMGVRIIFPSSREETSLVIQGSSIESIDKAVGKINSVLEEAIQSPVLDYSHFVSLPLAIHPELVEKLNNFQNSILRDSSSNRDVNSSIDLCMHAMVNEIDKEDTDVGVSLEVDNDEECVEVEIFSTAKKNSIRPSHLLSDLGIDRSIFIKPKTFHLTVLMLKLWNKARVDAASEVLQKIYPKVLEALENRSISIRLKGLECMKGSPAKARVLYAPVEEIGGEGRLMRACQVIIEAYAEAGLVIEKDARQMLTLHATLMNARHRKRKISSRKHDSFDARSIFKRYGSVDWGEYLIPEVHLSQRFSFSETGYYHCCASIPLPGNMEID